MSESELSRLIGRPENESATYWRSLAEEYKSVTQELHQRALKAEADAARLRDVLRKHHEGLANIGVVGFPTEKSGWIEIDLSAKYSDSTLHHQTVAALNKDKQEKR